MLYLLLLGLARILPLHLPLRHLLHLLVRCGRVVDITGVCAHLWRLSLVSGLLAHVLMMSVVDSCIIRDFLVLRVHCVSQLLVVVERLFAGLLQGEVCAVGHLLGLVVLLGGQALDKLVILLYLLLVVLH